MAEFATGIFKGNNGTESAEEAVKNAKEKLENKDIKFSIVISSSEYNYQEVLETVERETGNSKIIGSSSLGEFTEEGPKKGSVAVGLVSGDEISFYSGMGKNFTEKPEEAIDKAVNQLPEKVDNPENSTILNFHDGLAGNGTQAVWNTVGALNQNIKMAGGSAADDFKLQETMVFKDKKAETDAIVLGMITSDKPFKISVAHGHKPVTPPLEITKAEGNIIHELNNKPAIKEWKKHIKEDARENMGIDVEDAVEGSKELSILIAMYEFGSKVKKWKGKGDESGYKVRWPGLTNNTDGAMYLTCDINEGSSIHIMKGPKEEQLKAARRAAKTAKENMEDDIAGALVFECGVRATILGDDFYKAVEAVKDEIDAPILGFETYGEVCVEENQMSGFHNTTTVVMLIPK